SEMSSVRKSSARCEEPARELFSVSGQFIQFAHGRLGPAVQYGRDQRQDLPAGRQAEHRKHIALDDSLAAKADKLVEGGLGISHTAVRAACHRAQRLGVNLDGLL